jgi:hypothetical protein
MVYAAMVAKVTKILNPASFFTLADDRRLS